MASSTTLDSILKLVATPLFQSSYWEQGFLHVERLSKCFYEDLLTFSQLDILVRLALRQQSVSVRLIRASDGAIEYGSIYDIAEGIPSASAVYKHYVDGYSVLINRLHTLWPSIIDLCLGLEKQLKYPIGVNLYLTPGNAQCFQAHFDTHDVIILQIHGSKTWRLFPSPADLPLDGDGLGKYNDYDGMCLANLELRPGDLLYIPRGIVHEARSSTTSSVHLTVGVHVYRNLDVLSRALERAAKNIRYLRESVSLGLISDGSPGWRPETLDELSSYLRTLLGDPATVKELHAELTHFGPSLSLRRFSEIDGLQLITLETRVRRRDGAICKVSHGTQASQIQFLDNWVRGPEFIHEALAYVAANQEFTVAELPDSLTDDGKLTLTRRLVSEGLLLTSSLMKEDI